MKSQRQKKIYVGLSGGVDSAVSATLLISAGYDVTGIFIKVWQPDWLECNWKEERREAMRVAAHLNIPFVTLDLEKEYKEGVIDYMISEYKIGRTPNPDVMCNREVKFGAFWQWAKKHGADFVATGHYARNVFDSKFKLLAGRDSNKDQSYFLWTLNQEDLAHILFPIGSIEKPEVRRLARKFKLPNANKKDSQGLCFIGKVNVKEFLAHYIHSEPGNVLNEQGEVIGKHPGSLFFTIGERHGFTITDKTPDDDRYYVIDKDADQNTITVSNRISNDGASMNQNIVRLNRVNWISGSVWENLSGESKNTAEEDLSYPLKARSRYRQTLQNIRIVSVSISEVTIEFENHQDTLSPGQSLVIYDGDECLGGGIIE